jgi:hypothetical protein
MWRVLNMLLVVLIGLTIYKTYDIKHDVMEIQNNIKQVKRDITVENNNIAMYQAEWANLTSAFNLNRLKEKLLTDYRPLNYKDIRSVQEIPFKGQLSALSQNQSPTELPKITSGQKPSTKQKSKI